MKNDQPNAAERRWRETVRGLGSIMSFQRPALIHHCVGRTARHNKVDIGHYFILPLTDEEHRAIHASADRKDKEKTLFKFVLQLTAPIRPPSEVVNAIFDYHR